MKFLYTAVLALLFCNPANATIWNVSVANNTFNPATINAVVGDEIKFNWVIGIHTTTCGSGLPGTSLPAGAAEWDAPMTATATTFSYIVAVPGIYLYGCTPHFAFGMQGTITVSGVLPVQFGSFAVSNADAKALVQWQTFSEQRTDYFSIRKSTDATSFYEVGRVVAAGNSSTQRSYNFTDTDLGNINKYLYYEIVTVDMDGKETFSPIKMLRNNSVLKQDLIVSLSPNPISRPGQAQLKFNADKRGTMDVTVVNMSGQVVLKAKLAAFYGLNNGHLHVCDLQKGIYNVIFSLAGKRETRKIVVL
jgi:plastocyanin